MSHSSLSAQLASLNASGGKNAGSTLGTSKRHDDAVGRGVAHSTTHGHALAATGPKFKPSVLYADARTASDVPLTTLRENAVSSLRQLARSTRNDEFVEPSILQSLMGVKSLDFERGLATRAENEKLDKTIVRLLSLLSTVMGESSASCLTSSLHVIEYLLRRYDIHVRPNTSESLLLAALPHHELPVFLRILQLVDLASTPTWVFLRPYAAKGSPPPNRTLIAKRASRDNAIVVHCCEIAKKSATIHAQECKDDDYSQISPRRGVSRVISFAAAVLVEALAIQTTIPANQGSIAEPTLRCMFPFILSACGDNKTSSHHSSKYSLGILCADWRGFGYILSATVSERSVLSTDICQVLATTLVKGGLETDRFMIESSRSEESDDERIRLAADCILAVRTVLSNGGDDNMETEHESRLLILDGNQTDRNVKHYIGYNLSSSTFRILVRHKFLAQALGHLNADRNIPVAPMVASLLVTGTSWLFKDAARTENSTTSSMQLLLKLIQEPSLDSIWTNPKTNFASSYSSVVVQSFANHRDEGGEPSVSLEAARSLLDAMREVNSTGCDAGIADAVTSVCRKSGGKGSRSTRKRRISLLMGLQSDVSENADDGGEGETSEKDVEPAKLLPPRVALEHPEASVRLNAIQRAVDELTGLNAQNDKGESLERALLRRIVTDDVIRVAAAAGNALVELLTTRTTNFLDDSFVDMALIALCKWSVFKPDAKAQDYDVSSESPPLPMSEERLEILDSVLSAAAYATQWVIHNRIERSLEDHDRLPLLIHGIVAHLDLTSSKIRNDPVEKVSLMAANAFQFAFGQEKTRQSKTSDNGYLNSVKMLLLTHDLCSSALRSLCSDSSRRPPVDFQAIELATFRALQRRYLWVVLVSANEFLKTSRSSKRSVSDSLACSLCILQSCTERSDLQETEVDALLSCFRLCAQDITSRDVESIPGIIVSLASVASAKANQNVGSRAIKYFCEGVSVSPVAVVMEATSRAGVPSEAVDRLLSIAYEFVSSDAVVSSATHGVVPALMLLGSDSELIRKSALTFLSQIADKLRGDDDSLALKDLCHLSSKEGSDGMRSTLLMNGESALPKLVAKAVQDAKDPSELREYLIRHCFLTAMAWNDTSVPVKTSARQATWLPLGLASGGCRAAASVLRALELAGEAAYPLSLRWMYAGSGIFEAMLQTSSTSVVKKQQGKPFHALVEPVVSMLKGVIVVDPSSLSNVVISTGPGRSGRRVRSYSVGKVDGVSYVKQYPNDMYESMLKSISPPFCELTGGNLDARELVDRVISLVFTRSWGDGIFKKLPPTGRRRIASCLLYNRTLNVISSAGVALQGLPLDSSDITYLLKESSQGDNSLSGLAFLGDWIRFNPAVFKQGHDLDHLVSTLFEVLGALSSASGESDVDIDEAEYTRNTILQALQLLSEEFAKYSTRNKTDRKTVQREISGRVPLLVGLTGGATESVEPRETYIRPLSSGKMKSTAISILTNLCSHNPSVVIESLVPALMATMVCNSSEKGEPLRASRAARDAFVHVVPIFCEHASQSELPMMHLVGNFIIECQKLPEREERFLLYRNLIDSVSYVKADGQRGARLGSIVGAFIASEVFRSANSSVEITAATPKSGDALRKGIHEETRFLESSIAFALELVLTSHIGAQLGALFQLLRYVNQSLAKLGASTKDHERVSWSDMALSEDDLVIVFNDIERVTLYGPLQDGSGRLRSDEYSLKQRIQLMTLTTCAVRLILKTLQKGSVSRVLGASEGPDSALCLKLWQDLLCVQAVSFDMRPAGSITTASDGDSHDIERALKIEKRFWDSSKQLISESLECLQNLLPAHMFLASVISLIGEDNVSRGLRARAVRLVAERATESEPNSAEASIFLDMIPVLVDLLNGTSAEPKNESTILLHQSALIAIEHLTRTIYPVSRNNYDRDSKMIVDALQTVSTVLRAEAVVLVSQDKLSASENASAQLQCSAALCSSTLVRVMKSRCLPFLPKVVEPLMKTLISTNTYLITSSDKLSKEDGNTVQVLQLSTLRAIMAVAETLPQFLLPYLGELLSPAGIPSRALRMGDGEHNTTVKLTTEAIQSIVSTRTPARQLIPVACKALSLGQWHSAELLSQLSILEVSVRSAQRDEIPTLMKWVVKALITTYEHDGSEVERVALFDSAHKLLLALVLKISEVQLRPLYAGLREWRGDADPGNAEESAISRRLAFWSLSSVLAKELRSIFLPYLSLVVSDAVEELEFAVSTLCSTKASKKSLDGKKKRRLALLQEKESSDSSDLETLRPLQPLLLCLEYALQADAHEGGNWVRAGDGERFNSLLSPLGKLLQSRIPVNFPVGSSNVDSDISAVFSPFQQVVQGVGEEDLGSVSGCLTALGAAAGSEQLWKPLNHLVLEVCDNERSEVRKAGVGCLLTLIKTLGEEYMVLLPECLPVLSELLEDTDEEITALVQQCVSLGEELLGESLQDNLR